MRVDFLDRRFAFERKHAASFGGKRKTPDGQSVERCDSPGGDYVSGIETARHALLGPRTHDFCVRQAERRHRLRQESGPARQRLDQYDR